jgi:hypothetical protein
LAIFVLDKRKKPLMPCSEKRARLLLTRGRGVVHRRHPFMIRLKDRVGGDVEPVRRKIDPDSKTTGITLIADEDGNKPAKVLGPFELVHRRRQTSEALTARRAFRRRRLPARNSSTGLAPFSVLPGRQARVRFDPVRSAARPRAGRGFVGGRTKYNRARLGIAKTHALDAACVGEVGTLVGWHFPRGYCMRPKSVRGFKTGDMVRAEVPNGKQAGIHVGRVAVRASGSFTVGTADGINAKYCKLLDRADGCGYAWRPALPPPAEAGGLQRGRLG